MEALKDSSILVDEGGKESVSSAIIDFRKPTLLRSVMSENRMMLMRRWRLAQGGLLDDEKTITRWFPGQRNLLEMLEAVSEQEVEQMAECTTPLFAVTLPAGIYPGVFQARTPDNELEIQSEDEIFLSLSVRLDSLRLSTSQAAMIFGLTNSEVNRISRFGPHELRALARDPMMHVYPVTSDNYFVAAATRTMTEAEKTVLATVSRRSRDSIR